MNGYVIAPDGFVGTLADSYTDDAALAADNLVFLPAAGFRDGSFVGNVGAYGYYWSSSAVGENDAYYVLFLSNNVYPGFDDGRSSGHSVRLVTDVPAVTKGTAKAKINDVDTDVKWMQLWKDGPKFAEFNVGAENNKPEDFGSYLAVTDLASKIPDLFGDNWRLPTLEDYEALLANCTYEYIDGDVTGSKFTGKGDYSSNSIFLPIAGYMIGDNLQSAYYGFYWTSTPIDDGGRYRNYNHLQIGSLDAHIGNQARTYKESVRLVLAE